MERPYLPREEESSFNIVGILRVYTQWQGDQDCVQAKLSLCHITDASLVISGCTTHACEKFILRQEFSKLSHNHSAIPLSHRLGIFLVFFSEMLVK